MDGIPLQLTMRARIIWVLSLGGHECSVVLKSKLDVAWLMILHPSVDLQVWYCDCSTLNVALN